MTSSASAKPDASAQPDDFDCERSDNLKSTSARSDAFIAIQGPGRLLLIDNQREGCADDEGSWEGCGVVRCGVVW